MLIDLYNQLFIMSAVFGALYLILKVFSAATTRFFKSSWHYCTYIIIYMFLLLPYHKLVALLSFNPKIKAILILPPLVPNAYLPTTSKHDFLEITDIKIANTPKNISKIDISFLPYLLITGTLVFLIVILIQSIKIHHRIFSVCRLSDNLQFRDILLRCEQEMGMSKNVPLYISSYASTPFLYGIISPRIILPDIQFTTEEIKQVFQHELTHWKRHDTWFKWLMLLINAVHWFNPFVYLARLDIDHFCELSCDESVVSSMNYEERKRYCELMLGVLWNVTGYHVKLSAFSDKRKQLERRLNMILENKSLKSKKWVRALATTLTLALLLGGTVIAYAANTDGKEVTIQLGAGENVAVNLNDTLQSNKIEGTEASISTSTSEDVIEGLQKLQTIEPNTSGSLSSGSSTTFDKQYLTSGDTVTITETSSNNRDLSVGLKSVANGNIYAATVSGGNGTVVATVNTSGYYYIYVKNVSTGSTKFTCDYVMN